MFVANFSVLLECTYTRLFRKSQFANRKNKNKNNRRIIIKDIIWCACCSFLEKKFERNEKNSFIGLLASFFFRYDHIEPKKKTEIFNNLEKMLVFISDLANLPCSTDTYNMIIKNKILFKFFAQPLNCLFRLRYSLGRIKFLVLAHELRNISEFIIKFRI